MACPAIHPYRTASVPVATASGRGPRTAENGQNCGILTMTEQVQVLAAADGASFATTATRSTAGDHLVIQPFSGVIRVHFLDVYVVADDIAGGTPATADQVTYEIVRKDRRAQEITLSGSFLGQAISSASGALGQLDGYGIPCGNWQCMPVADNDAPLEVALRNNTAGVIVAGIHLGYEYVG